MMPSEPMSWSENSDVAVGIRIVCSPGQESPEVDDLTLALQSLSSDIRVEYKEPGLYNAWEWLLPAAAMLYIGKPFLDGFLKELGTGTAKALQTALVNLFHKAKSTGKTWSTVDEVDQYIKKLASATELGESTKVITRPGKPVIPLRISVELPNGVEARFVFPADLNNDQVLQGLGQLKSVLPSAFARDQRRSELLTTGHTESIESVFLSVPGRHELVSTTATYVYDRVSLSWIDADEALATQVRQKHDLRSRQKS